MVRLIRLVRVLSTLDYGCICSDPFIFLLFGLELGVLSGRVQRCVNGVGCDVMCDKSAPSSVLCSVHGPAGLAGCGAAPYPPDDVRKGMQW